CNGSRGIPAGSTCVEQRLVPTAMDGSELQKYSVGWFHLNGGFEGVDIGEVGKHSVRVDLFPQGLYDGIFKDQGLFAVGEGFAFWAATHGAPVVDPIKIPAGSGP